MLKPDETCLICKQITITSKKMLQQIKSIFWEKWEMFVMRNVLQQHHTITLTWRIYHILLNTFFSFLPDVFTSQTQFLSLSKLKLPVSMLMSSFHFVSEFLAIFIPFCGCCESWLPCIRLSLHYERRWQCIWRKLHE